MNRQQIYQDYPEGREILPGVWEVNPDPPGRLVRFLDRAVPIVSWIAIIAACLYFGFGFIVWMVG